MSYIGNTLPANFQSLPAVQRFNGDGSDTTFTLAAQIANDQSILVSVDGVTQDSNAYSVSGTTLTFTAAPSSGTGNIFVHTISPVGSTVVPPDGIAINATTGTFSGAVSGTTGTFSGNVTADKYIMAGGSQIGQDFAYLKAASTSEASLTLRKDSTGADSIDYLQMRSDGNGLISKITGAGVGHFTGVAVGGSGAANTLDDYEEGTYTATIACASGSITLDSSFNELAYTKVGRVVHVQGFLKVSSVSSPTGATNLNLPFTSVQTTDHSGRADNLGYAFLNGSAVTNGNYILFCELLHNQANNRIFWDNNNSGNNIGDNATAADTDLRMNFSYIAA